MTRAGNKAKDEGRGKAKGQIALWMLTKFAMIFFILALSLVLLGYSGMEKKTLCRTRADSLTSTIGSSFANVLTAPVEDERKVIPLERVLSIGESDYIKYKINITSRKADATQPNQPNSLIVEVLPTGVKDCNSGGNVAYPQDTKLKFVSPPVTDSQGNEVLEIDPYGGSGGADRSWYLVIIKCTKKTWPTEQYVYIENCKSGTLSACALTFDSVAGCCGWAPPASHCP